MTHRSEDNERTLLFVDLLGFKKLTLDYPTRVIDCPPDEKGFESSSTGPIQNKINRFYRIIDTLVSRYSTFGLERAILFSDCAFIDAGNSSAAASFAAELMRNCIQERIPIRMGLGKGTFYVLGIPTDIGDATVSRSRFVGSAVVRAYSAERCGGKGMRIFVHSSVEVDLQSIRSRVRTLKLKKAFKDVTFELDYLHPNRPAQQTPPADKLDRDLFEAVASMKDKTAPIAIRRHYIETHKAMNEMRKSNNRKRVSIRGLKSEYSVDPWMA